MRQLKQVKACLNTREKSMRGALKEKCENMTK